MLDMLISHFDYVRCNLCDHLCRGNAGLALHFRHRHHGGNIIFKFVPANRCPLCSRTFPTVRQARLHVARFFPRPCAGSHNDRHNDRVYELHAPRSLHCVDCPSLLFRSFDHLQSHCRSHLQQLSSRYGDVALQRRTAPSSFEG